MMLEGSFYHSQQSYTEGSFAQRRAMALTFRRLSFLLGGALFHRVALEAYVTQ
jgi:hypothetical protein